MDKRQYEQAFDKYFKCRKYSEALEVTGAMKYTGIPGARYLEMLVFYERGEYEKIRIALKGKRIDNIEEREFYLASLTELMMYDEFNSYYSEYDSISEACLNYISGLMRIQGHTWMPEHKAVMDYPTYFDRKYRWFAAELMADVFNLNEEKIMLINAGMPTKDINDLTRKTIDIFEMISPNEAIDELIKRYVDDNSPIPVENILYLPLLYSVAKEDLDKVTRKYEEIPDIIDFLKLARKIHLQGTEEDAIERYWKELSDAAHDGNTYVTDLMANLYADKSSFKTGGTFLGQESVSDRLYSALEKDAPYVINDIESHEMDERTEATLSPNGLFAYRAAGWMYCNALRSKNGGSEEHILCLSFLRIIEAEINERIIYPFCERINIRQQYEDFKSALNELDKGDFSEEWEYRIICLEELDPKKHTRLRFAGIMTVFDALRFKRYRKDSFHREFAAQLRSELGQQLTEEGKTALADGRLLRMVEPKVLERFRHTEKNTRYSGMEMALECRRYVEHKLIELAEYTIMPADKPADNEKLNAF